VRGLEQNRPTAAHGIEQRNIGRPPGKPENAPTPDQFGKTLASALAKLKEVHTEVVVLGPSVISDTPEAKTPANELSEKYAEIAAATAKAADVAYIDMRQIALDHLKANPPAAGKSSITAGESKFSNAWHQLAADAVAKAIGERMAATPMRIDLSDSPFIDSITIDFPLKRARKGAEGVEYIDPFFYLRSAHGPALIGYGSCSRGKGRNAMPGSVLTANTYCLRTGDRCMSLFHSPAGAVTLMFANDKWTRNEQGTTMCGAGGTAQMTITAEYPMPPQLDDPLSLLIGHGTQTVAAGGDCTGGGAFTDRFERTGD